MALSGRHLLYTPSDHLAKVMTALEEGSLQESDSGALNQGYIQAFQGGTVTISR